MKYIYILALLILIIICCCYLKISEGFKLPTVVLNQINTNVGQSSPEDGEKLPDNISSNTLLHAIDGISKPISGSANYEPREDNFEKETKKCNAVKFCKNLTDAHNCGYCLQDDIEGKHPFHYGNEKGPYGKRRSKEESLCKSGVNRDGKNEWISPGNLNGKKQKQLEAELEFIREKFPWKEDPRRTGPEASIMKEIANMGIEDTGYSGCMKMRERYICSKVNDCSPMNITMFGIKAKDICGFCADDGKAYPRIDLSPYGKSFKKIKYVTNPKCENIEIFGDGVNCSSNNSNKEECLSKRSLTDPSIPACAYNYNSERKVITVGVPNPSEIKFGKTEKTKIYDKCNSEWGLIRPSECSWFEQSYPCLKSKSAGPHSDKCLQSLWNQLGFQTNYRVLLSDEEGKEMIDSWHKMDIDSVTAGMEILYNHIFSYNYDKSKKWVKLCYGLDVNVCNRSGFITDDYPSKYWSETSNPCMSLLYRFGGGKPGGLANPEKGKQHSWGRWYGTYEGFESQKQIKKEEYDLYQSRFGGRKNWRVNETDTERLAGNLGKGKGPLTKVAKRISHKDYINRIRKLNRMKDMSNSDAKRIRSIYRYKPGGYNYSNANWVDKLVASKMITGNTPEYPVKMSKPCWPDFARKVLIHPYVKLLDINTLSFNNSYDFYKLSYPGKMRQQGLNKEFENLRRSGERFFTSRKTNGYDRRTLKRETYEQETFPFWIWIKTSNDYWKNKWHIFRKKALDYSSVESTTYKDITRPTNIETAKNIAKIHGFRLGGGGYSFYGNYGAKGLYVYNQGKYRNMAFFGTGGGNYNMKRDMGNGGKSRINGDKDIQALKFLSSSRFYNKLKITNNINIALSKPFLFEYTDEKGKKVRILFSKAWKKEGFPYYDLLKVMSDLK